MNKNVKEKWIIELKSGEYLQGLGALYDPVSDRYCCLGVLCDIAFKEGVCIKDDRRFDGEFDLLPKSVVKWAGLDVNSPRDKNGNSLVSFNDIQFMNFNQIADVIERDL